MIFDPSYELDIEPLKNENVKKTLSFYKSQPRPIEATERANQTRIKEMGKQLAVLGNELVLEADRVKRQIDCRKCPERNRPCPHYHLICTFENEKGCYHDY